MILHEFVVDQGSPGASCDQSVNVLVVLHSKWIVGLQVLLTDSEDCISAGSQCIDHVVEAFGRQQVCSKTSRACHYIKCSLVRLGKALFTDNEGLNVFVDALALQVSLLGRASTLCIKFCQVLFRKKCSNLGI